MSRCSQRSSKGKYRSHKIGKGPHKSIIKNQKKRMPWETEKPSLIMIDGKPAGGTSASEKDQDGHGMMKSKDFFSKKNIIFEGCRTHVVATTVCPTGSVHTLTCCTHIFLHMARAQSHLHIFMRVHIHAWLKLKSCQKGVCCTCVILLHLAFSISCFTHLCCS